MSGIINLLNGYKSYLGFLIFFAGQWLGPNPDFPAPDILSPALVEWTNWAGGALGGFGVIHKLAKASPQQ